VRPPTETRSLLCRLKCQPSLSSVSGGVLPALGPGGFDRSMQYEPWSCSDQEVEGWRSWQACEIDLRRGRRQRQLRAGVPPGGGWAS